MGKDYDFSGWVTVYNQKCADGVTIKPGAFKHLDGVKRPLVWMHQHTSPDNVIGNVFLKHCDEGVYGYGSFNNGKRAKEAREALDHGDIDSMSIWANQLQKNNTFVMHGEIREVSLVLAGANPGAVIDYVIKHGEDCDDEAFIFAGHGAIDEILSHADESDEKEEEEEMAEENKEKTVQDVLDEMTEEQRNVAYYVAAKAVEAALDNDDEDDEEDDEDSEGGNEMKHNAFDRETERDYEVLSHADQMKILERAKQSQVGTFQNALQEYMDQNELVHDGISGFAQTGEGNISWLFPEHKDLRTGAPELLNDDQSWVTVVMNKVHKSPISRIRTRHVDIRNVDSLRAKGYFKGNKKEVVGNYNLVRRTTDPQTVYVKSALHRDDIIDITDFDIVAYQYNIDRSMLMEELATAIMFGDGREPGAEDKIDPDKIRPIYGDDELYTMYKTIDFEAAASEIQGSDTGTYFGENFIKAEAMINTCLYAREKFKGTGTPDMFIEPHQLNIMLLARDRNGNRIHRTKAELAQALNVGNIYTVEQMVDKQRTVGNKTMKLHALIVNLADYQLGATKGGEVTHFTQFDIDFNQQKSLLETRCSGANTRVYSAIAIEEEVTA